MKAIHRTAVFAIHQPTHHACAVLERAFRDYTAAYTELLHACHKRYDVDALRGLATFAIDEKSGKPRMSARTLSKRLWDEPTIQKTLIGVCAVLESRLRQSVKEHVAQTLLSYAALCDAHTADQTRGGVPEFPARLRPQDVERVRMQALADIAPLADNRTRERELVARLQQTRQSTAVSIPFVGVDARYGCGLYYHAATRTFYARLDIVASSSRHGRPIRLAGRYTDIKTGIMYESGAPSATGIESFGRGTKSILVPLEMGRWHESRLRFTCAAFLPQRGTDQTGPAAAVPVAAKLVRREVRTGQHAGEVRYELHVSFEMPNPVAEPDGLDEQTRPLLALNRGIHQLVAGVVTNAQATQVVDTFAISGRELRALQEARERVRQTRQRKGAHVAAGDRRQSRLAEHHVAQLANQVVEMAMQHRAQVVMEDLGNFATGHALRDPSVKPTARRALLRSILNRRQFQAVMEAIDQRLELVGLPPVRAVGAAYISQTCPQCGAMSTGQHYDPLTPRTYRCQTCGASADVDLVAAANVARKLAWLRRRGVEKRAGQSEEARTTWQTYARSMPLPLPEQQEEAPSA